MTKRKYCVTCQQPVSLHTGFTCPDPEAPLTSKQVLPPEEARSLIARLERIERHLGWRTRAQKWLTEASDEKDALRVEPFIVKHYASDERPSIKGNGFDGLEVGEDRQEAEEFVAWLNTRLPAGTDVAKLVKYILRTPAPSFAHGNEMRCVECMRDSLHEAVAEPGYQCGWHYAKALSTAGSPLETTVRCPSCDTDTPNHFSWCELPHELNTPK